METTMDPTNLTTLAGMAYPLFVFAEALGICVAIDIWCLHVRDRRAAQVRRLHDEAPPRMFMN